MTNKEHDLMLKELYKFADKADLFTVRILTLANALKSVNGVSMDDIYIDGEFESDYHRKIAILDGMQLAVIEGLYKGYSNLLKDDKEAADSDKIKK